MNSYREFLTLLRARWGDLSSTLDKWVLGGYSPVRRAWRRHRPLWVWRRSSTGRVAAAVVKQHGLKVLAGPFAGLQYPERSIGHSNCLDQKLLGSYEPELSGAIEEVVAEGFESIVNIGAAEGFYAVGLALRSPNSVVYAFETDAGERRLCRLMAEANGVEERVIVEGTCTVSRLSAILNRVDPKRTFLLSDCEGCEKDLLSPDQLPFLKEATVLAELHPTVDPTIPAEIASRFRHSHHISGVARRAATNSTATKVGTAEGQVKTEWIYLRPRTET